MSSFVKALVATTGERRAVITRRADDLVHVAFERWDDTAVGSTGGYNDPFWRPDGEGILVHTEAEAEALARTRIGPLAGEG
ncbi:MAG: hypothetical protein SGI84_03620 [Gemmatimonadota bacterium]|mgnify:CR=1 FL=1|nr:hypothetical protein [Gemmatimonadota bacterium]